MRWPGTAAARMIMLRYALAGPRSPDGCSKETRRGIISRTSYNNHYDTTHRITPATNVRQLVSTSIPGHREAPVRRTERRRPGPHGSRDNESRGRNGRRYRPYPAARTWRLQRPMYRNEDSRPAFRPIGRANRMAFTRNHEREQTRRLPDDRGIPVGNTLVFNNVTQQP